MAGRRIGAKAAADVAARRGLVLPWLGVVLE